MKREKTSLFKMTPKSLTDSQTKEVFSKFKSVARSLGVHKLPHVIFETNKEKTRISYKYKNQSEMWNNGPEFAIEVVTSCQGLEKVQLVRAVLNNCGLCHGAGDADITQRKFKQIDNVLANAFDLFCETCKEHSLQDAKELKFDGIVKQVRKALKEREVKSRDKRGYSHTEYYLGNAHGEISVHRESQTFDVRFENLTPSQAHTLGRVISSL